MVGKGIESKMQQKQWEVRSYIARATAIERRARPIGEQASRIGVQPFRMQNCRPFVYRIYINVIYRYIYNIEL